MHNILKGIVVFYLCLPMACTLNVSQQSINGFFPPKISIPESMSSMIVDAINDGPDAYFPSESKVADIDIHTQEEAYRQLLILYPEKSKMIECWTRLNNHFIFSVGHAGKLKNSYSHILYVQIGGRKFGYYWPHS